MSAMHTPDAPARSTDTRHLYRIINTVSSTLDLDRVLRAIVDLVSDAVDCHACFVYVVEPDASLVLRAVSDPYTALVGRLRFEPGEGLAGWVAEHDEPVFLAEGALTDPRAKVVPEAEEDRYQSLVAVLLCLRNNLGARIGQCPLGQEHRLVVLGHPSGQSLAGLEPEPPHERGVRIGHCAQDERGVGLDHVDEA